MASIRLLTAKAMRCVINFPPIESLHLRRFCASGKKTRCEWLPRSASPPISVENFADKTPDPTRKSEYGMTIGRYCSWSRTMEPMSPGGRWTIFKSASDHLMSNFESTKPFFNGFHPLFFVLSDSRSRLFPLRPRSCEIIEMVRFHPRLQLPPCLSRNVDLNKVKQKRKTTKMYSDY